MEEYELSEATLEKMSQVDAYNENRITHDEIIARLIAQSKSQQIQKNKIKEKRLKAFEELMTLGVSKKSAKFLVQLDDEEEEE